MSQGMHITVNSKEIKDYLGDLSNRFEIGSSRLKIVGSRAVNRTLAHLKSHISKDIRKTYYVKKGDLDKSHIKIIKASPRKNMQGTLIFKNRLSLPLIHFGGKQNKTFVSVKVLRANRARSIQPGGDHKILSTTKHKRAAVWVMRDNIYARVEDQKHPIILWGPSFLSYFSRPGVTEELRKVYTTMMEERVQHEAEVILSGIALNNFGRGKK